MFAKVTGIPQTNIKEKFLKNVVSLWVYLNISMLGHS